MTQWAELKQLAEAARDEVLRSHGWEGAVEDADLLHTDEAFVKASSPAVVLALIAEIERLRALPVQERRAAAVSNGATPHHLPCPWRAQLGSEGGKPGLENEPRSHVKCRDVATFDLPSACSA